MLLILLLLEILEPLLLGNQQLLLLFNLYNIKKRYGTFLNNNPNIGQFKISAYEFINSELSTCADIFEVFFYKNVIQRIN